MWRQRPTPLAKVEIVQARDSREIDAAFATLAGDKVEGVTVAADTR